MDKYLLRELVDECLSVLRGSARREKVRVVSAMINPVNEQDRDLNK